VAGSNLVVTKDLANEPFRAVSNHRASQLLRGSNAETADAALIGQDENRTVPAVDAGTALIYLLKFRVTTDPLGRRETV